MKASNVVVTTVAALSMASVMGIAYAQPTYSDPQTGTMNQQDASGSTTQDSRSMPRDSSSMDSSRNTDSTSTSRSQPRYNERVARADRN